MDKCTDCRPLTVADALVSKVKYGVPDETLRTILVERGIDGGAAYADEDRDTVRLAYADLLKWFIVGPGKVNNTSDTDNGWSHTGGGYELSRDGISRMRSEANAIYAELEPGSALRSRCTFRVLSHGVRKADLSSYGQRVPRIQR